MSRKTLIIGYGNTLRGDDGVGQRAAQALSAEALPDAHILACHQLTPELAELLAQFDRVIFIDAAADATPGDIVVSRPRNDALPLGLGHHLEPHALLGFARRLYGDAPEAFLVKVGAASFAFDEQLSDPVQQSMPALIAAVIQLVRSRSSAERDSPGEGEP